MLRGLPDRVERLLDDPPLLDKMLLELSLRWSALPPPIARMAAALRLFLITWDPLETMPDRPDAFATTNGTAEDLEIVIYLPIWSLNRMARDNGRSAADVIATLAGSAMITASRNAAQLGAQTWDSAPDLVADETLTAHDHGSGEELGRADIALVSARWEPIGLGAITDVVRSALGAVDLDRSVVELAPIASPRLGCPACAGERFGFIADLAEAQARMCAAHASEAQAVTNRRLARANASNPKGWAAILDASVRLDRPHLPNGLAGRLGDVNRSMYVVPEAAELVKRASTVVQASEWFVGRADDFAVALGEDPELPKLPDWTVNLIGDLGRVGRSHEAAQIADALTRVAPDREAEFACEVAIATAVAGDADEARALIAENIDRWPDDLQVRISAGDAMLALSDTAAAQSNFEAALSMAEARDEFDRRADIMDRLICIQRAEEAPRQRAVRHQPKHKPSRAERSNRRAGRRRR